MCVLKFHCQPRSVLWCYKTEERVRTSPCMINFKSLPNSTTSTIYSHRTKQTNNTLYIDVDVDMNLKSYTGLLAQSREENNQQTDQFPYDAEESNPLSHTYRTRKEYICISSSPVWRTELWYDEPNKTFRLALVAFLLSHSFRTRNIYVYILFLSATAPALCPVTVWRTERNVRTVNSQLQSAPSSL